MKWLKNAAALFVAFGIAIFTLYAQDDDLEDFDFEDIDEEETDVPYFAVAAGFVGTWYFPDLDLVNEAMGRVIPNGEEFSTPLFLTGWQGFLGIGLVDNLRVGFISMSGAETAEASVTLDDNNQTTVDRRFEYNVSFNGVNVDYAFPISRDLVVLPGVVFGFGELVMSAAQSTEDRDYGRVFDFDDEGLNYFRHLEASHVSLQGNVNIEYSPTRFAMLRLNAGYILNADVGDWTVDFVNSNLTNPPDISTSGFTAQVGIFVGLFY